MKNKNIKVGSIIFVNGERDYLYTVDKIENDTVFCTDSEGNREDFELEYAKLHDPKADKVAVKLIQKKINKATSLLDSVFKELEAVRNLSCENHFYFLDRSTFSIAELEYTLIKNGWSVSSLRC